MRGLFSSWGTVLLAFGLGVLFFPNASQALDCDISAQQLSLWSKLRQAKWEIDVEVAAKRENRLRYLNDPTLTPVGRAMRGAVALGGLGLRTIFAPTTATLNAVTKPLYFAFHPTETSRTRMALMPYEAVSRALVPLSAYFGLTAMGYNPGYLLGGQSAFLDDWDKARPATVELAPDEIVVFIANDSEMLDRGAAKLMEQYVSKKGIRPEQIVRIDTRDVKVALRQMAQLRAQGHLKDIHILSHSAPGYSNLDSNGAFDAGSAKGEISLATLPQLLKIIDEEWAPDLLSAGARMNFYGCDFAKGPVGDDIIIPTGFAAFKRRGGEINAASVPTSFGGSRPDWEKLSQPGFWEMVKDGDVGEIFNQAVVESPYRIIANGAGTFSYLKWVEAGKPAPEPLVKNYRFVPPGPADLTANDTTSQRGK